MTSPQSLDALFCVISETLRIPRDKIAPEIAIHQIDTWNSLTHIELVVTIEERFKIQLSEDEIVDMTSVGEIQRILTEHGVLASQ
jgi:acyl carrier protein